MSNSKLTGLLKQGLQPWVWHACPSLSSTGPFPCLLARSKGLQDPRIWQDSKIKEPEFLKYHLKRVPSTHIGWWCAWKIHSYSVSLCVLWNVFMEILALSPLTTAIDTKRHNAKLALHCVLLLNHQLVIMCEHWPNFSKEIVGWLVLQLSLTIWKIGPLCT